MVGSGGGGFGERRLSVCSHPGLGEGFHHRLEIHYEFGLVSAVEVLNEEAAAPTGS